MNEEETLSVLSKMGLSGQIKRTGHPDYKRCYVYHKGVTLGRGSIFKGELTHINWYGEARFSDPYLLPGERFHFIWGTYLRTGLFVQDDEFERALAESKRIAQERYDAKKKWREENPKKRKRLYPPNPRTYLYQEIERVLAERDVK